MLKTICAFSLICTTVAQAVITRVDILRHKDRNQLVYLYSDMHTPTKKSIKQRDIFVQQANKLASSASLGSEQNLCVFVEDMLTAYYPCKKVENFIRQCRIRYKEAMGTYRVEFLVNLVKELLSNNITAINVEFRQRKTASLEGKVGITVNEGLNDVYQVIEELEISTMPEKYKSIMNQELAIINQRIEAAKPFIDALRSDRYSLRTMLKKIPHDHPALHHALNAYEVNYEIWPPSGQKQYELIDFYLDLSLIELRLFVGIGQRPNTRHIMACAGALHIDRLRSLLEQTGFTIDKTYHGTEALEGISTPEMKVGLPEDILTSTKVVDLQKIII